MTYLLIRGNNGRVSMRGADLRGATLREADLQVANLSGADLSGATLREADLRGADLRGALVSVEQLHLARVDDTTLLPETTESKKSGE